MASLAAPKADSGEEPENVGSLNFLKIMKDEGYKNITVKSFIKGNKRLVIAVGVENYTVIAIHQSTVKCIPQIFGSNNINTLIDTINFCAGESKKIYTEFSGCELITTIE
tara:strand:- start:352 stop:681 length:330 start_codon:yes stop_codon:yes gene_type:complete